MAVENLIFGVLAIGTLIVAATRFGWNSFISFGVLGAFLYSIPAIIGFYNPINVTLGYRDYLAHPTTEAVLVLSYAWLIFFGLVVVLPVPKLVGPSERLPSSGMLRTTAVLSVLGYIVISSSLGPLYFLKDRSETEFGLVSTLWRWAFVLGLVFSFQERRYRYMVLFSLFVIMHMIAGDRTIPAISIAAIMLSSFASGDKRSTLPPFKYIVIGSSLFTFLLVLKPIYIFIKDPTSLNASLLLNKDQFIYSIRGFEPLGTFSLFAISVDRDLRMPLDLFLSSVLGNFLVFPSFFGVDTNYFNKFITDEMPGGLNFGVAGNFFANGYVSMGGFGVAVFAFIFIISLYVIEVRAIKKNGVAKAILCVLGATVAIYAHRNGLDNLLSFVRQIIVVSLVVYFCFLIQRKFFRAV